jgi:ribosomal protein S18 acetylase RimI-like enzyme
MERNIQQTILTQELKEHIYAFFNKHCIATVGINGYTEAPISFEIRNGDILIGCIVVQMFWGQAHIKYLIVEEKYRNQGIATKLMKHVFDYAKSRGCNLVFVETMNFQAPEFYKKLGFKVEMKREGYAKNTSFYYLYKNLNLKQNQNITTKALELPNIPIIFDAFAKANWQKYSSIFETYFQEQQKGERLVWLAYLGNQFAGYVTLKWQSQYEHFAKFHIPEIMDLNVLPTFRKQRIGSKLLEIAEKAASAKTDVVGIGVGLYGGADGGYGASQKLYVNQGYIPDGNGVTYNYHHATPGKNFSLDDNLILWFTKKLE